MNIPASLAQELLAADFENVRAKLKSGASLTAAERAMLQKAATSAGPANVAESTIPPAAPGPALAPRVREDLAALAAIYGKCPRSIRRWIDEGAAHSDPCPVRDPASMPGWWSRRMKQRCPQSILDAAGKKTAPGQPSAPPSATTSGPNIPSNIPAPDPAAFKIDLAALDPEEGDRLRELQQLQAAKFRELAQAFAAGHETAALEARYVRLCEAVDKMESRVVERLKKQGHYILRAEVEAAIGSNAELLRQSHESMKRRVLERCPSLTADQRAQVSAAIETAREAEIRILARVDEMTAPELDLQLAS